MTVARVYRITFKQRNCTVTIKQDKITHNEKGTDNEVSFVEIMLAIHDCDHAFLTAWHLMA